MLKCGTSIILQKNVSSLFMEGVEETQIIFQPRKNVTANAAEVKFLLICLLKLNVTVKH